MKGKDKDNKTGFPDFLKYQANNLSGKEKNSFERELQKDPFASEAEEGFSSVDPSLLTKDIEELEKRLRSRAGGGKGYMWYRIAASVAVLMVIATVFFIALPEKTEELAVSGEKPKTIFEIPATDAIKENPPAPAPAIAMNMDKISEEKSMAELNKKSKTAEAEEIKEEVSILADTLHFVSEEIISAAAVQEKAEAVPVETKAPASRAATKSRELRVVRGKVISSEDNLPIPGVSIVLRGTTVATSTDSGGNFTIPIPERTDPDLIASFIGMKRKDFTAKGDSMVRISMDPDLTTLDEVVVMTYDPKRPYDMAVAGGVAVKDIALKEQAQYSYKEAVPIDGKEEFNRYIDENIVKPASQGDNREVVVISFIVKLNGMPANIKVIRSPGKQFSDEATRLIMEGPKWKPATENGVNIEGEVRVRLVFK